MSGLLLPGKGGLSKKMGEKNGFGCPTGRNRMFEMSPPTNWTQKGGCDATSGKIKKLGRVKKKGLRGKGGERDYPSSSSDNSARKAGPAERSGTLKKKKGKKRSDTKWRGQLAHPTILRRVRETDFKKRERKKGIILQMGPLPGDSKAGTSMGGFLGEGVPLKGGDLPGPYQRAIPSLLASARNPQAQGGGREEEGN